MTVRPAPGVARIGLRTADGCFYPLMSETFRGVRQVVLTTAEAAQRAADVELFREEPGGGERYRHLGTVHLETGADDAAPDGAGRPDLVLRVSLDAGGVLHASVTGPAGQGELRAALQDSAAGETALRTAAELAGVRETIAAGLLDGEPRAAAPAATAWRAGAGAGEAAAGGDVGGEGGDGEGGGGVTPIEPFVYRCTSTLPVNAAPYDRERVRWLAERPDLSDAEADLLRSIYRRLERDRDPARARQAQAALRSLDERTRGRGTAGPRAAGRHADGADDTGADAAGGGASSARQAAAFARASAAFDRREYGAVLRLLHAVDGALGLDLDHGAARAAGAGRAIPADLADYWLDDR